VASKSITELRGIAQAIGVPFSFGDTAIILQQKIDNKVKVEYTPPEPPPAYVPMDARLRNKPPSRELPEQEIRIILSSHIERGLHFDVDQDTWTMRHGDKTDTGTMHCPPRTILQCADKIMR